MKHSIGFIGGGRVTRILLQGFMNRKVELSTSDLKLQTSDNPGDGKKSIVINK